jgi:hypothetical protein
MQFSANRFWGGLVFLAVAPLAGDASAADCLTSSGKTACGFHCVSSDGQVRCSQTPEGVCSVASGVVACWDPPSVLRRVFGDRLPAATCATTYGQTACGYSCETNSDRALCAQTPFGQCQASDGRVACWDPPAAVILTRRERTPAAQCLSSSGKIACGYHCMAHEGGVRCSQTPEGTCSVQQGKVVCWDPPLDSLGAVFDPAAELACMDAVEGRACGYRCIATTIHSGCGMNRGDSCKVEPEGIVCKSPE